MLEVGARQKAEITDGLLEELEKLAAKIFVRDGIVFSYTDNISNEAEGRLKTMFPVSDGKMMNKAEIPVEGIVVGAIKIEGDTGYSGTVTALPEGRPFDGAMMVAARVVSLEHLYKEIREIGGAYGTGMSITLAGLVTAYMYRNPTPVKSRDAILKSAEALRAFVASDRELDRYIVATVSGMDPYLPPVDEAFAPVELYMNGRTFADFEVARRQIITTEKKDLLAVAEMLDSILPAAEHVVVGGDRQTEGLPAEKIERLELGRKE